MDYKRTKLYSAFLEPLQLLYGTRSSSPTRCRIKACVRTSTFAVGHQWWPGCHWYRYGDVSNKRNLSAGPRFQCRLCKKYCKASDKVIECEDCEKRFQASCAKLGDNELLKLESRNGSWYCKNCKADCGLCSGAVLKDHKAVQCDNCEMWVHNGCSFITETLYETLENTNCTWICPKCEFFNFSNSFLMLN